MVPRSLRFSLVLLFFGTVPELVIAERIALLPFADPSAHDGAREYVEISARKVLTKHGFELVSEDSVAHLLRDLRIRNTAVPSGNELRALADSLDTELVLVGTIHQFTTEENYTEVTLSARMIRAADATMLWTNWITVTGGGEAALLSKPVYENDSHLAKVATRKLLKGARSSSKSGQRFVTEIRTPRAGNDSSLPFRRLAVIPPTNESTEEHAGEMTGDLLVTELVRRGFMVAEPGAVRSIMLQCDDLRHGQTVEAVSRVLADSLGVDIVLTGSISALTDSRNAMIGVTPEISMELRMIDAHTSTLVWAKSFSRAGDQGFSLFKIGVTHSPAALTQLLIRDAVDDIPVIRRSSTTQPK